MTPPESYKALEKAADALENADYNLKGGFTLATANRPIMHAIIAYQRYCTQKMCTPKPIREPEQNFQNYL